MLCGCSEKLYIVLAAWPGGILENSAPYFEIVLKNMLEGVDTLDVVNDLHILKFS